MSELDELLERLNALPEDQRNQVAQDALRATEGQLWVPNPGPQTRAYFCEADELFYGGQAGGGKSDMLVGLALNEHKRSLILRRYNEDARSLGDRLLDVVGSRDGWNGQRLQYTDESRSVQFGGCQHEEDKQRYKGRPHDLIGVDEVTDFSESQYTFITAWNRSADSNQRCRVVATGNPPTTAEGLWVIRRWGPWLDPNHPNPAEDGELRWFTTDPDGEEIEVDGPGPHWIGGQEVVARSRTFIRAKLSDNPDLAETNYDAVLASLPAELRAAYREGRFDLGLKDDPWQVIPTDWVRAAQARWTEEPPKGVPMCTLGVDVAQGGDDNNVIAPRHDGWYAPLIRIPGKQTPLGTDASGVVVANRRDDALVIVDGGGGYGGSVYKHLKDNGIPVRAYKGAEKSRRRSKDQQLKFYNRRAEAYWRFREALDPAQPGGSRIMLPPDQSILADLTAPKYEVMRDNVVKITSKEKLTTDLGRSPDDGDAIVMAWTDGPTIATDYHNWQEQNIGGRVGRKPQVVLGHSKAKRGRH